MITLDLSILNQKGTPMFNSDLTANRPAAGIVGRIFIATDSPYGIFRDTGTAWDQIAGSGGGGGIKCQYESTHVAFWSGTSAISGSNNLWWNSTNNYLGIGTNSPGNPLDVHGSLSSVAALNQTTVTNNTLLSLLNSGTPLWRIGNYYTSGANDFAIFDVVGALQQLTIVNTTGQTFIGAKTTASGRLVINSATADAHLQIIGVNSPSIRIDNAGSGGTQRFAIGNATATNNFIQGSSAGQFCITTASSGAMLFGMWQTTNATEVMRISTASNLLIGTTTDAGYKLDVNGTARVSGTILCTAGNSLLCFDGGGSSSRYGIGTSINTLNLFTANTAIFGVQVDSSTSTKANSVMWYDTEKNLILGGATTSLGLNFKLQVTGRTILTTGDTNNVLTISNPTTSTSTLLNSIVQQYNAINFASNNISYGALFGCGSSFSFGTYAANEMNLMSLGNGHVTLRVNNVGDVNIKAKNSDPNNSTIQFKLFGASGNIQLQDGGTYTDITSAKLSINSSTQGFLPPRMTTTQKNAIGTPAQGIMVFDTTLVKLCVYNGTAWETITSL